MGGRLAAIWTGIRRTNPHTLLVAVIAAVMVIDLVVSVFVPFARYALVTEPAWETANADCSQEDPPCPSPMPRKMVWEGILSHYWIDLRMTFAGLYLLAMPVAWLMQGVTWWPWQPFVWLAAVGSGAAVLQVRRLAMWPRVGYAVLLALVVSGFAAYHWSTAGD